MRLWLRRYAFLYDHQSFELDCRHLQFVAHVTVLLSSRSWRVVYWFKQLEAERNAWGASKPKPKSLMEIQAEEAERMRRTGNKPVTLAATVAGTNAQALSAAAAAISSTAAPVQSGSDAKSKAKPAAAPTASDAAAGRGKGKAPMKKKKGIPIPLGALITGEVELDDSGQPVPVQPPTAETVTVWGARSAAKSLKEIQDEQASELGGAGAPNDELATRWRSEYEEQARVSCAVCSMLSACEPVTSDGVCAWE